MYTPFSWKKFPILQQPDYDKSDLHDVVSKLLHSDTVVSKESVDLLLKELQDVSNGNKMILQIGDCAEAFNLVSKENTELYCKMFSGSASYIESQIDKKIVIIGRIAGQFAKPRSDNFEEQDGISLPSYRGDIANGIEFNAKARKCSADRILEAYNHSKKIVHFIKGFCHSTHNKDRIFVSHESLVLDYDAALTRQFGDKFYCLSADMLWVGYRTAQIDHAHVEFLRGIENPVGLKVGINTMPEYLVEVVKKLNPDNKNGKIILIARFGIDKIENYLPKLINAVKDAKLHVTWINDPMHGNGYKASNGYKTRSVAHISGEISSFYKVAKKSMIPIGGLHLEATALSVTECVHNPDADEEDGLKQNYQTACDPRLNSDQVNNVLASFCQDLLEQ